MLTYSRDDQEPPAELANKPANVPGLVGPFINAGPRHCRWPLWETEADPRLLRRAIGLRRMAAAESRAAVHHSSRQERKCLKGPVWTSSIVLTLTSPTLSLSWRKESVLLPEPT